MSLHDLPTLNAALNGVCAALLLTGFRFVRARRITAHRRCMWAALVTSCLFLTSYLTYHAQVGSTRFAGQGWIRPIYFAILLSHTVLAAAIVPMALLTLRRALRDEFDRHRRLARWTLPLWLYVSVTGVVIYVLLYHAFPST
jgi:uncharacterized membrane protein YozB (DUF420 family)